MSALLELRDLTTRIATRRGVITIVDGVSFTLDEGECFGLVGESGSGKSMVCRSILRLPPTTPALMSGRIAFDGDDLLRMTDRELNRVCGRKIAMIVQDAIAALNPVLPVGTQIGEAMLEHGVATSRREARARAVALMRKVGIPSPETRVDDYPHEFSGGMCQRVVIAAALACTPRVILADEPTTALDVTIQDQILKLIAELQRELRLAVLLVTHDMGVVAQNCQRVAVMYSGRFVELAATEQLFRQPLHPYSAGLLSCVPTIDGGDATARVRPIAGSPPDIADPPSGCRFHPRCPLADDACRAGEFPLREVRPNHFTACIRHEALARAGNIWASESPEPVPAATGGAA
ncbi:MAG: ABC transporter ATP-binding protein [Alphaproteobacteria bacterium]|nr:ABC transporter ATP-binding protein [Alphaproteobacteria bacterium]